MACNEFPLGKKLKYTTVEGQNGFIYPLNRNELIADANLASAAWRTIQRSKRRSGIIAIGGVHGIIRIVQVRRIERVVRTVAIRWIHWITGIIAVRRVEGIVWRVGLCGIQRVVWGILIGWIENIVIALVFLREVRFGNRRCDGEEQRQEKEKDNLHGEPPECGTTSGFSLLPAWRSAQVTVRRCRQSRMSLLSLRNSHSSFSGRHKFGKSFRKSLWIAAHEKIPFA